MNFGEKLKTLRQDKGLTQPELADAMGIEQSYLSKLENGKSLPSNDMLNRILDVFGISVGDLVDNLDQGVRNQLRQIPDVAEHLNQFRERTLSARRRWIVVSALLLSLGVGLTIAGGSKLFFPDVVYQYRSEGIVLEGEPKEIFDKWHLSVSSSANQEEIRRAEDEINARIDEDYLLTTTFRGTVFNTPVEGGSRTYYLRENTQIDPWQNKALVLAGMMMLVAGALGLGFMKKAY